MQPQWLDSSRCVITYPLVSGKVKSFPLHALRQRPARDKESWYVRPVFLRCSESASSLEYPTKYTIYCVIDGETSAEEGIPPTLYQLHQIIIQKKGERCKFLKRLLVTALNPSTGSSNTKRCSVTFAESSARSTRFKSRGIYTVTGNEEITSVA